MTYFDHSQIRFEMPFLFKLCQYQNFKLFHGLFMFQESDLEVITNTALKRPGYL